MIRFLRPAAFAILVSGLWSLCSCQSTIPDAADLDRYEVQATDLANRQIALLDGQLQRGEITQQERDRAANALRAGILRKAHDLAWTRHELSESEKRAWGVPTGDAPVNPNAPQLGQISNSFYQAKGEVGSGFGSFSSPNVGNQYRRGYTPSISQAERERAIPSEQRRYQEMQQQQNEFTE